MATTYPDVIAEARLPLPMDRIREFCQRWRGIVRLELFGSVLRPDFGPASDVDVLVTFTPDADYDLFQLMDMEEELQRIVGRKVDLVSRRSIERSENWLRREAILGSARTIYER